MGFQRFTKKNVIINSLTVIIYLMWTHLTGGIRPEHYFLALLWLVMFYTQEKTRRFILGFSFFIIFWIIYDSMRILPNYEINTVHIKQPYELEKALFGIHIYGQLLTPNEYFAIWHNKILDFLSGFFYINWIPLPLAFAVYLYFNDKILFLKFSAAFLLVNLAGFIIYYIYPAAPPWYVHLYGFDLHIGIPGHRAGLARFDELIHYPLFKNIYSKNANVLAAMPSLHATYPLIVLFYGIKKHLGWVNIIFVIFTIGIWFAAVYTSQHYVIDVVAGIMLALVVLFTFENLSKKRFLNQWILDFTKRI